MENISSIYYIVSCYLGKRRILTTDCCSNDDKLYFIKQQVNKLNELNVESIKKIIFTVNLENDDQKNLILDYLGGVKSKIKIETIFSENSGFSYKSWETAIIQNINEDVDYFFLIEDDYIPIQDHFYNYFLDRLSPYVGYVCELVFHNHPSGPNGIMRRNVCQKILKDKGRVFDINDGAKSYVEGETNQANYLNYMINSGFIIKDIAEYMKVIRMDHYGKLATYGNPNRDPVIEPLYCLNKLTL